MGRWRPTRRQVLTHGATAAGGMLLGCGGAVAAGRWAGRGEIPEVTDPGAVLDDASAGGWNVTPHPCWPHR
jgi:hypothetical protein